MEIQLHCNTVFYFFTLLSTVWLYCLECYKAVLLVKFCYNG